MEALMLILRRKPGESIIVGEKIKITVLESNSNQLHIGIEAPKNVEIYREEIYLKIKEENEKEAKSEVFLRIKAKR